MKQRWVVVGLLMAMLVAVIPTSPGASPGALVRAAQADLGGCGAYFAIASIGLEARIAEISSDEDGVVLTVNVANERPEDVLLPVGEIFGTWQLASSDASTLPYDAVDSVVATSRSNGGSTRLGPGDVGVLVLIFPGDIQGDLTLRNDELGGDLSRDGVSVCEAVGGGSAGKPSDDGTDIRPTATPTEAATSRSTATATAVPPTATAIPHRPAPTATATPERVATGDLSADDVAELVVDEPWRADEYIGDEPLVWQTDCDDLGGETCVIGTNDIAMFGLSIFDSERDCSRYLVGEDLDFGLFGDRYAGYDYVLIPSYLSDDGSALAVAQVGQVIVFVGVEDPGRSGRGRDIDAEAEEMLFGLIDRVDRIVG